MICFARKIFLVFFLSVNWVSAQSLFLSTYTTDEGLPQNSVYSLIQDNKGRLWIGTEGGVAKYNGDKFVIYGLEDGLAAPHVNDIFQDHLGNIWFATIAGISKFNGNKFISFGKNSGLADDFVYSIFEDYSGAIWFGTEKQGVIKYANNKFTTYNSANGFFAKKVFDINRDNDGNLWFATEGSGVIEKIDEDFRMFNTNNGLVSDSVYSVFRDHKGRMIFGTNHGISIFDGVKFTSLTESFGFKNFPIRKIIEDKYYDLWFCYDGGGIAQFDGKELTNYTEKNGIPSNFIRSGLEDERGDLWFGSQNGLFKINAERMKTLTTQDGLPGDVIYGINQDKRGNYWIAVYGHGISILHNGKIRNLTVDDGLPSNNISCIYRDKKNNLWLGSDNGVAKFDGRKFTYFTTRDGLIGNIVMSIVEDDEGNIWFGGQGGATRYDGKNFTAYSAKDGLAPEWVYCIYKDSQGNLWFGSDPGGVTFYNGKKFIIYNTSNGLPKGAVFSIIEDRFNNYWFAMEGGGLVKFDGENFTQYGIKNGLSSTICYSIIEVGRYLYVGTGNGIDRIDHFNWDKLGKDAVRVFTKEDGLPNTELNQGSAYRDKKGNLWFGTQKGVVIFNPINKPNKVSPMVFITKFEVNKKSIPLDSLKTGKLELDHSQNNIDIAFSAVSLNNYYKMIFKYKLVGLNDSLWNETHSTRISYPYLPPNNYRLYIKARNADGVWCPKPIVLSFKINPPFYSTWWFYTLMTFGIILITYLVYVIKTEQVKKRNIELANMVRLRTKELEEEKNKSDELLQNILPELAVEELKERGEVEPREFKNVTILFTDFKGFTWAASVLPADKLVFELNDIFAGFDKIMMKFGLEKLKTIGDSYMAACGLPEETAFHAVKAIEAAMEMRKFLENRNKNSAIKWEMRIGLHSGQVIAGVVGLKKFTYDIWGDTVNIASRMESSGEPGKINISAFTYMLIRDYYECEYRGKIEAKGKGKIDMYFVLRRRPEKEKEILEIVTEGKKSKELVS